MPAPDPAPGEEDVFQAAAALPLTERAAYLDRVCIGRPELRTAVEDLLASIEDDAFMHRPSDRTATPELESEFARLKPEEAGDRIGAYKLLQQIGEGGFGVVWMAEQEKPVRRRVALKIIKLGMDTKEVIARFEQERQALALMDHPNIARVLDAGATVTGRPFFVMELVKGVRITEYCDTAQLSTAARLKLFIQVCHAVQHAHQKGIIHRDLKPSNILVTLHDGAPVPKVIDFGVAKATQQQRLTDLTLFTQFEQMIGTPLYMAPEQAELSGLDVDTRSDIYSLGVLLYELLTGRTPFDPEHLMKAGFDEMRRVIREDEPQKPSTCISTMAVELRTDVAKHRNAEGAKLINLIRGDLDWIVMKALEKDRNRRYETSSEFAKDIERHLSSEPVLARPPTPAYRFRRFVRRNKGIVGASVGIAAAILLGASLAVWQAFVARAESDRANSALRDLQATAPAFAEQARSLIGQERFDEALAKLNYAIKLLPEGVEYLLAKGDLLESQLRLVDAAAAYREALRVQGDNSRAAEHLALCEKLEAERMAKSKLSRESLAQLLARMAAEKRPAAEMMKVGKMLGEEKKLIVAYWLDRLKDLPIAPDRPLPQRLSVNDAGELILDLKETSVVDLTPLKGMPLAELSLVNCGIQDLGPLKGMGLLKLDLGGTKVADLSPLSGMLSLRELNLRACLEVSDLAPLRELRSLDALNIERTQVEDISPLRGMSLTALKMSDSRVSDLKPLAGMALKEVSCSATPATDFSPLAGAPLVTLALENTQVRDLSFLRGMPLEALMLGGCNAARGFAVFGELQRLNVLVLPQRIAELPYEELRALEALQNHPKLTQIQMSLGEARVTRANASAKDQFWAAIESDLTLRKALFQVSGGKGNFEKLGDGTWNLGFRGLPVSDLSPLKGMPIGFLDLNNTPVSDVTPLAGMKLRVAYISGTKVTDLSPLKGVPLEVLTMSDCLEGIDLSPLAEIKTLREILLPPKPRNLEALRALTKLQRISFELDDRNQIAHTAAEFWLGARPASLQALEAARQGKYTDAKKSLRGIIEETKRADSAKSAAGILRTCEVEWIALAAVIVAEGNPEIYQAYCKEVVDYFQGTTDARTAHRMLQICVLAPNSGIAPETLQHLLALSAAHETNLANREWRAVFTALYDYRRGNVATAMERTQSAVKNESASALADVIVALCLAHRGNIDAAKRALAEARVIIAEHWPAGNAFGWHDWLSAHNLAEEVERTIASSVRAAEAGPVSEASLREKLATQEKTLGHDHPDVARTMTQLAAILHTKREFAASETLLRHALRIFKLRPVDAGQEIVETLKLLTITLESLEKVAEIETLARERLALANSLREPALVGDAILGVSRALRLTGRLAECEATLREELPKLRKAYGSNNAGVAIVIHALAHHAERNGDVAGAEAQHREALEIHKKFPFEAPVQMIGAINCLVNLLEAQERYTEAETIARERLDFARVMKVPKFAEDALYALALIQVRGRNYPAAEASYREVIAARKTRLPADDNDVITAVASLGRLLVDWAWEERDAKAPATRAAAVARAAEGERLLRDVVKAKLNGPKSESTSTFEARSRLGGAIIVTATLNRDLPDESRQAKLSEAEELLLTAHPKLQADPNALPRHVRDSHTRFIRLYEARNNAKKATEWQRALAEFDKAQTVLASKKLKPSNPTAVGESVEVAGQAK